MPVTYRAIMPNCYNYNYFCPNCDHRFFTEKFRKHYLKEWSCITCFGCNQVIDLDNVIVKSIETGVEAIFEVIKNDLTFLIFHRRIFVPTFLEHNWEKEGF
tara:strand:- start:146 stop:448 length:303 start_codon:yes stop_codon:yes gene_type:complete